MIIYENLYEALRLSDLTKDAGISDFTKKFKKERTKLMGSESKNAKLVDIKINQKDDYVDFIWLTEATVKKYSKNHKFYNLTTKLKLVPDASKTYTMIIRILDFFKLLDTSPNIITDKDIIDVLNVANIKVWSDSPSYQFQGFNYFISQEFEASINPTSIPPTNKTNKNGTVIGWKNRHNSGDGLVGKHLQGIINNIKFYIPQMKQKLKTELKKLGII